MKEFKKDQSVETEKGYPHTGSVRGRIHRKLPNYPNTYELVIPGVGIVTRARSEIKAL